MKVISILSQKGGVGKTTMATCLAVEAELDGKTTAIIDLDPQATATFWHDIRENETPAVLAIPPVRLEAILDAAREQGTDMVIIDGAAVARDIVYQAATVADYVMIPTKAAVFDFKSMSVTIDIVRGLDTPFSIVQNFVAPNGTEAREAQRAAASIDAEICPITIGQRKSFFRAQDKGLAVQEYDPTGKGAIEIRRLYKYMCINVYKNTEAMA